MKTDPHITTRLNVDTILITDLASFPSPAAQWSVTCQPNIATAVEGTSGSAAGCRQRMHYQKYTGLMWGGGFIPLYISAILRLSNASIQWVVTRTNWLTVSPPVGYLKHRQHEMSGYIWAPEDHWAIKLITLYGNAITRTQEWLVLGYREAQKVSRVSRH